MFQAPPNRVAGRRVVRWLHHRVGYPILAFVLPSICFGCRRPLGRFQRLGACLSCWTGFRVAHAPVCPTCGVPSRPGTDLLGPARGRCPDCLLSPPTLGAVRAAVLYDDHARRFLLRAKLGGRRELLAPLGEQLAAATRLSGIHRGCTALAPVPSHAWTLLRRGFNPAVELARVVARRTGLPLLRPLRRRLDRATTLRPLGARGRRRAVEGAFVARSPLAGERVLLIDDVMTTGSTSEACARALRAAGASEVRAAVWARTPKGA